MNIKKPNLLFYEPSNQIPISSLKTDQVNLDCADEFNILGLFRDKYMSWNEHIQIISSKVSQIIDTMNKLTNCPPTKVLLTTSILQVTNNALFQPQSVSMGAGIDLIDSQ